MRERAENLMPDTVITLVRQGDVESILSEISRNPRLLRPDYFDGKSLLEVAMLLNCPPLVRALLLKKSVKPTKDILDLNRRNYEYLPLRVNPTVALFVFSCRLGHQAISEFLFYHYIADLEADERAIILGEGLSSVCGDDNAAYIDWLISIGADVDFERKKVTPLITAASVGANAAMEALIRNGASVNKLPKNGWDALWTATFNQKVESVKLLMQYGANPKNCKMPPSKAMPDFPSGYALDVAHSYGDEALINALTKPLVSS